MLCSYTTPQKVSGLGTAAPRTPICNNNISISWVWSFWLAFSMQFACSVQKMFRMYRESAAVRRPKKRVITCRIRLAFVPEFGRFG